MPCDRRFACHGCIVEQAREKMWTLRQALAQFLQVPNGNKEEISVHALSLKNEIDELITSNYKEEKETT